MRNHSQIKRINERTNPIIAKSIVRIAMMVKRTVRTMTLAEAFSSVSKHGKEDDF